MQNSSCVFYGFRFIFPVTGNETKRVAERIGRETGRPFDIIGANSIARESERIADRVGNEAERVVDKVFGIEHEILKLFVFLFFFIIVIKGRSFEEMVMVVKLFFFSILIFAFGCGTVVPTKPVVDDKPPVEGGFIEIANNPNANKSQSHLVSLLKELVGEKDNDLAFQKLQEIKEINFSNKGIVDISALQGLKKIEKLSLAANYVEDVKPLQDLLELQELYLGSNSIENVDSLGSLSKLKVLTLHLNRIENVNSLGNLTNLGDLDLGYNSLKDITGIRNINTLEKLNLYYNGEVKVGENIVNSTKLKELYVNICDQSKFTELENVLIQNNSVEILWLIYDLEVSLSGLHNIKSLKKLGIIHDTYSSDSLLSTINLSQFSEFVNLEELEINNLEVKGRDSLEDLMKPHLNENGETISLTIK